MLELSFSFLRDRSRIIYGSNIIYNPVILHKRIELFLLDSLNVRHACKQFHEEKKLAILIIVSSVIYYAIQGLRDRVTVDDIGGARSRVARMICIDNLSVGKI